MRTAGNVPTTSSSRPGPAVTSADAPANSPSSMCGRSSAKYFSAGHSGYGRTSPIRAYGLRSSGAQEALSRMQMPADDDTPSRTAEAVLADITGLYDTDSPTGFDERRSRTRDGIAHLVSAAERHLGDTPWAGRAPLRITAPRRAAP
jgi:hypothetical protein